MVHGCNGNGYFTKELYENKLYIFLVFLPDGCVSVALRITGYAAAPLPYPPAKILRNLHSLFSYSS